MNRRALAFTLVASITTGLCATAGVASADAPGHRDPAAQMINLDSGTVVIYEDGRVYRRADTGDWYVDSGFRSGLTAAPRMAPPPPPGSYEWATLSDDAVDDLLTQLEELGLLDDDLDFGDPMITDSPTSTLALAIDGDEIDHSVYAPGYSDGLTADQQANREAFAELRDVLADLEGEFGDELSEFAPYVPHQWVVETGYVPGGDDPRQWPLADEPVVDDCVELSTDDDIDTATGGYLYGERIVYADAALPNDPRCS